MKTLTLLSMLLICFSISNAQTFRGLDKSPLDIAYLPDNYAHDRTEGEEVIAKVVYSRPQKKDRVVFGGIIPYGKVWRTGANENTEIRFYRDVTIAGTNVEAGTYSLFTIPEKDKWTIILNSDIDYWGAYSYNKDHDILRVQVASKTNTDVLEAFTIQFEKPEGKPAIMKIAWDNVLVEVPIKY